MTKLLATFLAVALPTLGAAADEPPEAALARGCEAGKPDDCHELAGIYSEGDGVAKDLARAGALVERAFVLYQKHCELGDGEACWMAGMMLHEGEAPKDLARENALFQRSGAIRQESCDRGDTAACFSLAGAYAHPDPGFARDMVRATGLYVRACAGGNAAACQAQGVSYDRGDGVARDPARAAISWKRAAELYAAACDKGEASACAELGYMYRDGQGVKRENADAIAFMQKSCAAGYDEACLNLESLITWIGPSGEAIERRDEATLQKGCDGGSAPDCVRLGLTLGDDDKRKEALAAYDKGCASGDGFACRLAAIQHQFQAQALFTRAGPLIVAGCNAGNARACQVLGAMASTGEGQAVDRTRMAQHYQHAAALFEKACSAGDAKACEGLATLLIENQATLATDAAKVVALRQKACDAGFADACYRLGLDHYRTGVGVVADPVKAKALVKKACDAGVPTSCDILEKLE